MKTETTNGNGHTITVNVHYCHCSNEQDWFDKLIIKIKNYVTKKKKSK